MNCLDLRQRFVTPWHRAPAARMRGRRVDRLMSERPFRDRFISRPCSANARVSTSTRRILFFPPVSALKQACDIRPLRGRNDRRLVRSPRFHFRSQRHERIDGRHMILRPSAVSFAARLRWWGLARAIDADHRMMKGLCAESISSGFAPRQTPSPPIRSRPPTSFYAESPCRAAAKTASAILTDTAVRDRRAAEHLDIVEDARSSFAGERSQRPSPANSRSASGRSKAAATTQFGGSGSVSLMVGTC